MEKAHIIESVTSMVMARIKRCGALLCTRVVKNILNNYDIRSVTSVKPNSQKCLSAPALRMRQPFPSQQGYDPHRTIKYKNSLHVSSDNVVRIPPRMEADTSSFPHASTLCIYTSPYLCLSTLMLVLFNPQGLQVCIRSVSKFVFAAIAISTTSANGRNQVWTATFSPNWGSRLSHCLVAIT